MAAAYTIRIAGIDDLDALMTLEESVFTADRLSRRAMRHAVLSPAQSVLAAFQGQRLVAAAITGFRSGSVIARLSSIAVAPDEAGKGLGRMLLEAAEAMAARRGAQIMRLEVREDNQGAIALYERQRYRRFGRYEDYYEDGAAALRFEKILDHAAF